MGIGMFHESIDAIGISERAQFAGESSKHHPTRQRRFQSRAAGFPVRWDFVGVSPTYRAWSTEPGGRVVLCCLTHLGIVTVHFHGSQSALLSH